MTEQEIIEITNKVFEEYFEIEKSKLTPQAQIFGELGLDSLDIIDLMVAMEEKFGVKVRDAEKLKTIRTLQDVYDFVISEKQKIEQGQV